ncbi:MAG: hypothetical protein QM765_07055 [Myxococcales bacterium]
MRGSPQLLSTSAGPVLCGLSTGEPGASALSRVSVSGARLAFEALRFRKAGGPAVSLEAALGATDLEVWAVALSADESWLALSLADPVYRIPSFVLAHRDAGGAYAFESPTGSMNVFAYLAFSAQGAPPKLYAVESFSGRVVRLDPERMLPDMSFQVPGVTDGSQLRSWGSSTDRRYLLVSDSSGTVHRFNTETASFLPPVVSERNLGAVYLLPDEDLQVQAVLNEGFDAARGAAGQVALSWRGRGTLVLGGGNRATALLPLEPDRSTLKNYELYKFATFGPGIPTSPCASSADCLQAPTEPAQECIVSQCRSPGLMRTTVIHTTDVASTFLTESTPCNLPELPRAVVLRPSGELVVVSSPAFTSATPPVHLRRLAEPAPECLRIQAALRRPPETTLPGTSDPCESGLCQQPVSLVAMPDGREALALPPNGAAFVVRRGDGAQDVVTPLLAPTPVLKDRPLHARALTADTRACAPGFVPALYAGWADYAGLRGAVSVHPLQDPSCNQVAPNARSLSVDGVDLAGLAGLAVTPNGRRLIAVLDLSQVRRVAVLEIERDADGVPTGLTIAQIVDVGTAKASETGLALDGPMNVTPSRVAFSADGSTAWLPLPGSTSLVTLD